MTRTGRTELPSPVRDSPLSSPGLLVTGTDTGIGKTTVACGLAAAAAARGLRVAVCKPVETGCAERSGELVPDDALRLRYFSACPEPLETICPYRFREPLAPAVAADRRGMAIDLGSLGATVLGLASRYDLTLVESAGGLLAPLSAASTSADLARQAGLGLLVVVGNRLGAINHARLTVEWARQNGLHVRGYVVNSLGPAPDLAAETNVAALGELLGPPLAVFPWLGRIEASEQDRKRLAEATELAFGARLDCLVGGRS